MQSVTTHQAELALFVLVMQQKQHNQSLLEALWTRYNTHVKSHNLNMLPRINDAIGHLKLTQIRPQHLNDSYKTLSENGVRNLGASFELSPALPVFHSRDLQNWEQICYAFTPGNGFHMEKNTLNGGIMVPTIRYHDGTFYIINMNYSDRGNFIITAKGPAGPWSLPHWLPNVPGIDACTTIFYIGNNSFECYKVRWFAADNGIFNSSAHT